MPKVKHSTVKRYCNFMEKAIFIKERKSELLSNGVFAQRCLESRKHLDECRNKHKCKCVLGGNGRDPFK